MVYSRTETELVQDWAWRGGGGSTILLIPQSVFGQFHCLPLLSAETILIHRLHSHFK